MEPPIRPPRKPQRPAKPVGPNGGRAALPTGRKAKQLRANELTNAEGNRVHRTTAADSIQQKQASRPGPWVPLNSSRVQDARWDGGLKRLDVHFKDGTPWTYEIGQYEVYRRFIRSASPGRFINRVLNAYPYHGLADSDFAPHELDLDQEEPDDVNGGDWL